MGTADLVSVANSRLGRVLNSKWRLIRLIAVGGMAAVYEASHRNGKRVAIKMLHPSLSLDEAQRARFLREGYAANAIGHPDVVRIDDDDIDTDGTVFLVMELLEGASLHELLERAGGRLPVDQVLKLGERALSVLEAAHAKSIVHRDIKPQNLFFTAGGALKVLDFGIARLREPSLGSPEGATTAGTLMGTPAFMAPEQARGEWELVDGRSDIYSVGATLFKLLSGMNVHPAATSNELLGRVMILQARSLASVMPTLPQEVVSLVDRALAYDPEKRWPSARHMREALREVMRGLGIDAGQEPELAAADCLPVDAGHALGTDVLSATKAGTLSAGDLSHAPTARPASPVSNPRSRRWLAGTVWVIVAAGAAALFFSGPGGAPGKESGSQAASASRLVPAVRPAPSAASAPVPPSSSSSLPVRAVTGAAPSVSTGSRTRAAASTAAPKSPRSRATPRSPDPLTQPVDMLDRRR
jgi:eukaryotic-like serine/threonine-protein kinase